MLEEFWSIGAFEDADIANAFTDSEVRLDEMNKHYTLRAVSKRRQRMFFIEATGDYL